MNGYRFGNSITGERVSFLIDNRGENPSGGRQLSQLVLTYRIRQLFAKISHPRSSPMPAEIIHSTKRPHFRLSNPIPCVLLPVIMTIRVTDLTEADISGAVKAIQ